MLARFGLAARHRQLAGHLSRGLQQRLSLARALLADPALLLLDEPFSGLDLDGTTLLCAAMEAHRRQGRSAIVCTHDLALGLSVADRFTVLDAGEARGEAACAPLRDLPPGELSLNRLMELK